MAEICVLTIENGLQAGRSLPLPAGSHTVGYGADNKVVVADQDMADVHFALKLAGKPILTAMSAEVRLQNGRVLQPGQAIKIRQDARFTAGNTDFHLSPPDDDRQRRARWYVAGPVTLVLSLLGFLVFQGTEAPPSLALQAPMQAAAHHAAPKPKTQAEQMADIADALNARALAVGLTGLHIAPGAGNTVEIAGEVPTQQKPVWEDIRQWFDASYGARVVVVDRTNLSAPIVPLNVAAVRLGKSPFVVDRSGQKLFVGSQTANGWTVDGIEATRVVLHRSGQQAAVTF